MSSYTKMCAAPKSGSLAYLWKINQHGEVVVEHLPDNAPIVSSSRDMVVMGTVGTEEFQGNMNTILDHTELRVAYQFRPYLFGCPSLEKLAQRLNAKGPNKAKTIWEAIPWELRPPGITWDNEVEQYVVVEQS